jgi:hypothetical protein
MPVGTIGDPGREEEGVPIAAEPHQIENAPYPASLLHLVDPEWRRQDPLASLALMAIIGGDDDGDPRAGHDVTARLERHARERPGRRECRHI